MSDTPNASDVSASCPSCPSHVSCRGQHGITGTRLKAEIRKATASRFQAAARRAGIEPLSKWQVRSLMSMLEADGDELTEEDLMRILMSAPWYPKPQVRRHGVGGPGWRTHT